MKIKSLLSVITINTLGVFCTFSNATTFDVIHREKTYKVERAGVLILKDYKEDINNVPDTRYAVFLGVNKKGLCSPFSGGCEPQDGNALETASRELREETGGLIKFDEAKLYNRPKVFSINNNGNANMLIISKEDKLSIMEISKSCEQAQSDKTLSYGYRENSKAIAIDLPTLKELVNFKNVGRNQIHIKTRKSENMVKVNKYYIPVLRSALERMERDKHLVGRVITSSTGNVREVKDDAMTSITRGLSSLKIGK